MSRTVPIQRDWRTWAVSSAIALVAGVSLLFAPAAAEVIFPPDESCSGLHVSVGDVTVVEGDELARSAQVPLSLSEPSETTQSVTVAVLPDGADEADFRPKHVTAGFAPGTVYRTVGVRLTPDTTREDGDEGVFLGLYEPTPGLNVCRQAGYLTIVDDD
jgi:hypothetical protein